MQLEHVLPTLPMFLVFPWLQGRFGFWWALLLAAVLRPFGTRLI